MLDQRIPKTRFTAEEYLRLEENSEIKHEFYDGELFPMLENVEVSPGRFEMMAGASVRHNQIAVAAVSSLDRQLSDSACMPSSSDLRLMIEATGLYTYPDVTVTCPPLSSVPGHPDTLTDATVVVEILSPSTANYDRGTKFENYRQLPSLRHYLLIEQDKVGVEHRFREAGGELWQTEFFERLDQSVSLVAIECDLKLADLYRRVRFE